MLGFLKCTLTALFCFSVPNVGLTDVIVTPLGDLPVTRMASDLEQPWSFGFLPDGGVLITERDGALKLLRDGEVHVLLGLPEISVDGQGGLLDVLIPKDFATSRQIYLIYVTPQLGGSGTALGVGQLLGGERALQGFRKIFEMQNGTSGGRHFGGRMVEAPDGKIFLTIGERGDRPAAQDLSRHNGSVLRLNRNGSAAEDNPFQGTKNARAEIWSYGHRNPQGAALDGQGSLWVNEHGARGGDEVNKITAGANFGWPVISYGRHYSGGKIGEGTAKTGMEQPHHYWDPSIAPSGLMIYQGEMFPEWKGHFFSGSLKFDLISVLDPQASMLETRIESETTQRVRDIREAPDGSIWFLSVINNALYRISR